MPYSYMGTQGLVQGGPVSDAFFARLGATQLVRAVCGGTGNSGAAVTMGRGHGLLPEELVHSRFIILWGTNTLTTNLHLWPFIRTAREAGATVVVIDPTRTRTAAAADWHVRPLPGTDTALALGLMHVIVAAGLVDEEYVAAHIVGFDALGERVADHPPGRVAEITGLTADEIERLARAYATTRPSAIRVLVGREHHEHGAGMFRAIASLPALVGAWRERGGGLCHMTYQFIDRLDPTCGVTPTPVQTREVNMIQLGQALTSLDPPLKTPVVYNSHPAATAPEQNLVVFSSTDAELAEAAVAPLGPGRVAERTSRGWLRFHGPEDVLPYADGCFDTPSGKTEFFSAALEAEGQDPLPGYRPAREGPQGDTGLAGRYPLIMLTAKGDHHFLNSSYVHVDRAVRAEGEPLLDIHPADAVTRGVLDGQTVRVFNERGSLTLRARVGDRTRPGSCRCRRGGGRPPAPRAAPPTR